MKNKIFKTKNNFVRPAIVTGAALLFALTMTTYNVTSEGSGFNWGIEDFIAAGILIMGTGVLVELAAKKIKNKNQRIGVIAGIILTLLVIWVELATDGVSRIVCNLL